MTLDNWIKEARAKAPRYDVARMSKVRFGIVDSDRANFLGLSFNVDMVGIDGGGAWLYVPRIKSLAMLEKYGSAENMNNKLCWVKIDGSGASRVHFERMID